MPSDTEDMSDDEMRPLVVHHTRADYLSDSEVFPQRSHAHASASYYRSRTRSPPNRENRSRLASQPYYSHRQQATHHLFSPRHQPPMSRAVGPAYVRFLKKNRVKSHHVKRVEDADDVEALPFWQKPDHLKRVYSICFAQALDLNDLKDQLLAAFRTSRIAVMEDEVIFVCLESWTADSSCFVFCNYGVVVFWNLDVESEQAFLAFLRESVEDDALLGEDDEAFDDFDWCLDDTDTVPVFSILDNVLVIPQSSPSILVRTQLAISYGVATSIKLETLELGIEKTIEATRDIPQDMSLHGKMGLSKKEISKYIGTLYIQKSSVNLMYDILDSPDYVWDDQLAEVVYTKCRNMLKIDTRVTVLNKRLDVLAELLEMLRTEKSEQHSTRLEWIVIILIIVEVVLGVVDIVYTMLSGDVPSVF